MATTYSATSPATATAGSHLAKHGAVTRKSYLRNCVSWPMDEVHELNQMIENATPISLATFRKHVDREQLDELEKALGYATRSYEKGVRLSKDYHVGFYRSTLNGAPVVYLLHSAIEYVFA
jgi:hypothetical protein